MGYYDTYVGNTLILNRYKFLARLDVVMVGCNKP